MSVIINNPTGTITDGTLPFDKSIVQVRVSATPTIANGTVTTITWTSEASGGTWNTDFWTSGTNLVIPSGYDGTYLIHAIISYPFVTAASISARATGVFVINGTPRRTFLDSPGSTSWNPQLDSVMILPLVAGNTVAVQAWHESGASRTPVCTLQLYRLSE